MSFPRLDGVNLLQANVAWAVLKSNVKSITLDPNGATVNVLTNDGNYGQFNGSVWTLVAGPHLAFSIPGLVTAGQSTSATLDILDVFNNPVLGYTGTVQLTNSDAAAAMPATHTFVSADNGTYRFTITFLTSGTQSLTATDANGLTTSISPTVKAAAASSFSVDPASVLAGTAVPVTVYAYDKYGNVDTGYTGTVNLSSTDSRASLPTTVAFTAANQGARTINATFKTAGGQTVVAADSTTSSIIGSGSLIVTAAAIDLSQSTVSITPQTVPAGGTALVTLTARDAQGNLVLGGGATVAFVLGNGTGIGSFSSTTDNGDGTYTATFTANSTPGSNSLSGIINGQLLTVGSPGTELEFAL